MPEVHKTQEEDMDKWYKQQANKNKKKTKIKAWFEKTFKKVLGIYT
jgi:hypothetical protein